jgi:hypothetical protein
MNGPFVKNSNTAARYDSAEHGGIKLIGIGGLMCQRAGPIPAQARRKWNRLRSMPAVAPQMKKRSYGIA